MRIWFKLWKDTRLVGSETIEDFSSETRTHKVMNALDEACHIFDLSKPIWLEHNISEFSRRSKTKFMAANFIDDIDFDYMEIHVLEEDY